MVKTSSYVLWNMIIVFLRIHLIAPDYTWLYTITPGYT
jgi:hypothetical protein